jgi:hypothetical protein
MSDIRVLCVENHSEYIETGTTVTTIAEIHYGLVKFGS